MFVSCSSNKAKETPSTFETCNELVVGAHALGVERDSDEITLSQNNCSFRLTLQGWWCTPSAAEVRYDIVHPLQPSNQSEHVESFSKHDNDPYEGEAV